MGNSALTLIFTAVTILVYWIYLVFLRVFWPGRLLRDTFARITAMETCLLDEARYRRTMDMYNLSADGLRSLHALKRVHDSLSVEHDAHLHAPFSYLRGALSLCKRAQRCKDDVEIQRLDSGYRDDDDDGPDTSQTRAPWSDWVDRILTSLFD
ncbi:hypothetical protein C8R47DRAFT_1207315 [Mycena vitilis]|nr:hypothetical protein C8R47DRAFT_1207315 [Mycena vitilis]